MAKTKHTGGPKPDVRNTSSVAEPETTASADVSVDASAIRCSCLSGNIEADTVACDACRKRANGGITPPPQSPVSPSAAPPGEIDRIYLQRMAVDGYIIRLDELKYDLTDFILHGERLSEQVTSMRRELTELCNTLLRRPAGEAREEPAKKRARK